MRADKKLLLTAVVGCLFVVGRAHRPLLNGRTSTGTEFNTKETALEFPWVEKSFAFNRVATCDAPFLWVKFDVPCDNFQLYIGAGIPRLARFADTRVGALLLGANGAAVDPSPSAEKAPPVRPRSDVCLRLIALCSLIAWRVARMVVRRAA
jgi:hypothetical protein